MTAEIFYTFTVFVLFCICLYSLIAMSLGKDTKWADRFIIFCISIPFVIGAWRDPWSGFPEVYIFSFVAVFLSMYLQKKHPQWVVIAESSKREKLMMRGMFCFLLVLVLMRRAGILI